jgi:hypothetical protein
VTAAGAARLIGVGTVWRATGAATAGRRLVAAVARGDEDEQAVAGMLLVRAGDRAVPLVAEALAAPATGTVHVEVHVEVLVDVLASIGSPPARAQLRRLAAAPSAQVADAARAALRALAEIDRDQP